jgi:hypothetical protein
MHGMRHGSRWAGLQEELRRFVLQLLCAAGGLAGLWLGFLAAPKDSPSAGLASSLAEVLVPVGWRVGAGVLAGAFLAWTVSIAIPWLRPHPVER